MLHISGSRRRALSAAVVALAMAGAGQVSAAQAAPTFSTYSGTTTTNVGAAPTITMTKPGQTTVTLTCPTLKPNAQTAVNWGTPSQGYLLDGAINTTCTGSNGFPYYVSASIGTGQMRLDAAGPRYSVTANSTATLTIGGGEYGIGNGVATIPAYTLGWTNGSGATPSKLTASSLLLGTTGSVHIWHNNWTLRLTGQWNVTLPGGGLITALP